MKKFLLTCIILLLAALPVLAHEENMDNTQGLFGLSPEYVHVLLNPLPTYGLIIGIVVLLAGLALRNIPTRNLGLLIVFSAPALFGRRPITASTPTTIFTWT